MIALAHRTCKTWLLIAAVAASTYTQALLAQETNAVTPGARMTYRDNTVYLLLQTPGYALLGGTYETNAESITSGQDPKGKNDPPQSYDVAGHDGAISFSVGRKGSEKVADWFSDEVGSQNNTFGHEPGKLNFAFEGQLQLSIQGPGLNPDIPVILPDIVLAQGHVVTNNWWFGGSGCTRPEGKVDAVTCQSINYPSMTFTFVRGRKIAEQGVYNASDEVDMYIEPK